MLRIQLFLKFDGTRIAGARALGGHSRVTWRLGVAGARWTCADLATSCRYRWSCYPQLCRAEVLAEVSAVSVTWDGGWPISGRAGGRTCALDLAPLEKCQKAGERPHQQDMPTHTTSSSPQLQPTSRGQHATISTEDANRYMHKRNWAE